MQEQFGGDTVEHTAVGRTPAVCGTMQIDGDKVTAASFKADLITTDSATKSAVTGTSRRVGWKRISSPRPPSCSAIPYLQTPAPGTVMNTNANGDLTIHGVTKRVTIPLMARWNGDTIDLSGGTGIVLADYGMHPLSVAGFVKTADHGSFELQLTFIRP